MEGRLSFTSHQTYAFPRSSLLCLPFSPFRRQPAFSLLILSLIFSQFKSERSSRRYIWRSRAEPYFKCTPFPGLTMSGYGSPDDGHGEAPFTASNISELTGEQLQALRKDQLAGLLAAFAKGSFSNGVDSAHPGESKPLWHMDTFTKPAPAPLDFHTWRRGVNEWLFAHSTMRDDLKLHYIRGALQGAAAHELRRLELRVSQQEAFSPESLLKLLESHYIPKGTREQARNDLRRWRATKGDLTASLNKFLDLVTLAGIDPAGADGWEDYLLQGLPYDIQREARAKGCESIREYYDCVLSIVQEVQVFHQQNKLDSRDAALDREEFILPGHRGTINSKTTRGDQQVASTKDKTNQWCAVHQVHSHNTKQCRAYLRQKEKEPNQSEERLIELAKRQLKPQSDRRPNANFRPQKGTL